MDLLHVRRDDHSRQTDALPGALWALWRHHVPDLEVAVPRDAKGFGALTQLAQLGVKIPSRFVAVVLVDQGVEVTRTAG